MTYSEFKSQLVHHHRKGYHRFTESWCGLMRDRKLFGGSQFTNKTSECTCVDCLKFLKRSMEYSTKWELKALVDPPY